MGRAADREKKRNAAENAEEAALEYEQNRVRFGPLRPRNRKQEHLVNTLEEKRIVFVTGPAGTGKTFVSTSWAVEQLESKSVDRIIISRPMIGCDEDIGFLPGTEQEKYYPWLGPFFDVLNGKLGKKKVESYLKYGKIIAKPLMMMRGETFRDAIVLLDEAQNTTPGQMKMILTRLGERSRIIVDGDLEQTDLPSHMGNGLKDAVHRFTGRRSAGFVNFVDDEITRDPLVRDVVDAYRD